MEGIIKPKGNYLLIEKAKKEKGAREFVQTTQPNYPLIGTVISVTEDKEFYPPRYKVGDRVLYPNLKGYKFPERKEVVLMPQSDVLAILTK